MTDHEAPPKDWITEQVERARENAEKRAAWEKQKSLEAEAQRVQAIRAEISAEKDRLRTDYMEAGIDPASFEREHWPELFRGIMAERAFAWDAERMEKLERAEREIFG